jgi:hypothetical protein
MIKQQLTHQRYIITSLPHSVDDDDGRWWSRLYLHHSIEHTANNQQIGKIEHGIKQEKQQHKQVVTNSMPISRPSPAQSESMGHEFNQSHNVMVCKCAFLMQLTCSGFV